MLRYGSFLPVDVFVLTICCKGVLGIKVKIMLDWDPKGKVGPTTSLPDLVTIHVPKEEEDYSIRTSLATTDIEVAAA